MTHQKPGLVLAFPRLFYDYYLTEYMKLCHDRAIKHASPSIPLDFTYKQINKNINTSLQLGQTWERYRRLPTDTTVGRNPLDVWSARRKDLYLTIHNTRNRQTSMPSVGFEPTIPEGERPQNYALDRAATGTGTINISSVYVSFRTAVCIFYENICSLRFDSNTAYIIYWYSVITFVLVTRDLWFGLWTGIFDSVMCWYWNLLQALDRSL